MSGTNAEAGIDVLRFFYYAKSQKRGK